MRANPRVSADVTSRNTTFGTLLANTFARGTAPIDPRDIVGGLFGLDLGGRAPLSQEERANAPQFLLLNQVLRPVAGSLLSGASMQTIRATAVGAAPEELSAMRDRIATLEATIQRMQRER